MEPDERRIPRELASYSLTVEQYEALLASQGNACAICRRSFRTRVNQIDHDHSCCSGVTSCGECVRGILCAECNTGLALYGDNPIALDHDALRIQEPGKRGRPSKNALIFGRDPLIMYNAAIYLRDHMDRKHSEWGLAGYVPPV